MWPAAGGVTPSARTTARLNASSEAMAQRNVVKYQEKGRAMNSEARPARSREIVLGTSSPRTTCKTVSRAKARAMAAPWASIVARLPGSQSSMGRKSCANAGSPKAPRARLVSVTPTCTPETTRSSCESSSFTMRARRSPRSISWRMREARTATSENSAAAKKPLTATSASTASSRRPIMACNSISRAAAA